jgi:hypothetical protein
MRSLLTVGVLAAACKVETAQSSFDFTSLSGQQILLSDTEYQYALTFCDTSLCGNGGASLCQSSIASGYVVNMGVWANIEDWYSPWPELLFGQMIGESQGCPSSRVTDISFACSDVVEPRLVAVEETSLCEYRATVEVPQAICVPSPPMSCCLPATFASKRAQVEGSLATVQRDAGGDWFDGAYQGRAQSLLCSTYYNRCFTYTPTSCSGSAYRPAPSMCFGGPDWTFVDTLPLTGTGPLLTRWNSGNSNYIVTMPLGSSCVPVSGSAVDAFLGFSSTPDSKLWEVPQICLKILGK